MDETDAIEVRMLHVCRKNHDDLCQVLDDKFLSKESFHAKMDQLLNSYAANKRWLIGEIIVVAILLFGVYQKSEDNINAVDRKASSMEMSIKAGNSMLDLIFKRMDEMGTDLRDIRKGGK